MLIKIKVRFTKGTSRYSTLREFTYTRKLNTRETILQNVTIVFIPGSQQSYKHSHVMNIAQLMNLLEKIFFKAYEIFYSSDHKTLHSEML